MFATGGSRKIAGPSNKYYRLILTLRLSRRIWGRGGNCVKPRVATIVAKTSTELYPRWRQKLDTTVPVFARTRVKTKPTIVNVEILRQSQPNLGP